MREANRRRGIALSRHLLVVVCSFLLSSPVASIAQENSIWTRQSLLDTPGGMKETLREGGVNLDNFAVAPWLRLTADLQWIDPATPDPQDALIGAIRTQIKF